MISSVDTLLNVRVSRKPIEFLSKGREDKNFYTDLKGGTYTTLNADTRDLTWNSSWLEEEFITKLTLTNCSAGFLEACILKSLTLERLLVLEINFDKQYSRMDLSQEVATKLKIIRSLRHVSIVSLKNIKDPDLNVLAVIAEKVRKGCVIEYDDLAFVKR